MEALGVAQPHPLATAMTRWGTWNQSEVSLFIR